MTSTQHMRQRIVQMAHTLFVQQGVEGTTMVAIAEAVGCSRRTVYTYYKDKQTLLMAVIEREISLMSQSLSEVLARPADAITRLMVLLDNHLQLIQKTVQRQGEHNASFFSDTFNIERLRLKYDQSEYDMLKRILQEGHDRGELVVPDINSTAYLLLKSFKSLEAPYINRYHHEYGKEDYLRIIAAMKQLLRQGLTNHANTKPITQ